MSGKDSKSKKIKSYILQLKEKDKVKKLEAIQLMKASGDESCVIPLVEELNVSDSPEVITAIVDVLNTAKLSGVPAEIARCLSNHSYSDVHKHLLSSVWNSGLDYRPYLKEIVGATLQGGLEEAIECITIIENLDGPFNEEQIFEPILILREYMVSHNEEESTRLTLLNEAMFMLQEINNQL